MKTFPVVLRAPGVSPPACSLYYEVAANGVFQVRDTPLYRAVTRAGDLVPGLLPERERLRLKCPRLPRADVEELLVFFDAVYRRHRGEAVALLFFCAETMQYRVAVPPQWLVGRRGHDGRWRADYALRYGGALRPPGFVRLGTVHSHADLPAYASGVDAADESFEDGLHVVFGDFGSERLSVVAAFVANGVRFRLDAEEVLEPGVLYARPPRSDWMSRVQRVSREQLGAGGDGKKGRSGAARGD
jgi:hypothetical protein